MVRKHCFIGLIMLLSVGLLFVGAPQATFAQEDPVLRIANYRITQTLDSTDSGQAWWISFGAGETLVTIADDGTVVPNLLESLTNLDERRWLMRLRPGLTFQNGKTLDAEALKAFLLRQSEKCVLANAQLPDLQAKVTGELEVTITTAYPDSIVPWKLLQHNGFIVYDAETVEAAETPEDLAGTGYLTGPYTPVELNEKRIVLERYDGYWKGRPALQRVEILTIPDAQARYAAVLNGEVDWDYRPSTEIAAVLKGRNDAFYLQGKGVSALRIEPNILSSPFNEWEARRAFGLSIDYEAIANQVMDGLYEPATGMFPEFLPYAVQNQVTDLFRANQLLDSIGWKMGDDGYRYRDGERLTVKFHVRPTFGDWVSHVLAVQDQVKATGFFVDIVQNDDSTLNLDRSEWDATIIGNATISIWSGNAEVQLVRYHLSDSVQNYSGMADPQIDRLAKDLMAEFDEAKRYQMLRDVQDIMIESKAYLIVASFSRPSIVVNAAYRNMKVDNWRNWVNWQTAPQQ